MDYKNYHVPVLVSHLMANFQLVSDAVVVDGTMGFAGHASEILSQFPDIHYYGFDKDLAAINVAKQRVNEFENVQIIHSPFSTMFDVLNNNGIKPTHILLDLGVSSFQIDQSYRGFTFQKDEPLDMRMDLTTPVTAQQLLATYTEDQLSRLFEREGDIKHSSRLVEQIINRRNNNSLNSTFDLVDCVKYGFFVRSRKQFIAMCTKVFQAIRVEVNGELNELNHFFNGVLAQKGVIVAIITFQPNEDKAVKRFVKENNLNRITKKPLQSTYHEAKKNPRERTAKLRIFQV